MSKTHSPHARECSSAQRSAIEQYVARHYGKPATGVLHELASEIVHIDVHIVPASGSQLCTLLFTTGMSALPMNVPPRSGVLPHAEVSLILPGWWQLGNPDPKWQWPIRELINAARYPHKHRTWLAEGHTIASSDPPRPFDRSTNLCAMLVISGGLHDDVIEAEVPTALLELCPIHADELEYKHAYGAAELLERLQCENAQVFVNPERESCVAGMRLPN
jgi:hypothetical protein